MQQVERTEPYQLPPQPVTTCDDPLQIGWLCPTCGHSNSPYSGICRKCLLGTDLDGEVEAVNA